MAEILLMKTIKFIISFICYFGTSIAFIDMQRDFDIAETLNVSPALQRIVLWLFIIFWVIKIIWFSYEHFYLETKERKQNMRKKEDNGKK